MNSASESNNASPLSLAQTMRALLADYLSNRRFLLALAIAIIGAGLAMNWSWLVAAGIAPILVALAPCAAMCALGLCMGRMGGKSCSERKEANMGSKDDAGKGPR